MGVAIIQQVDTQVDKFVRVIPEKRIRLSPKMDLYCTVPRFTPTKKGVARIQQDAQVDKFLRVIPENGRH